MIASTPKPTRLLALVAGTTLAAVMGIAVVSTTWAPRTAQAQATVPGALPCSCAQPTSIPSLRSSIVHCKCGSMTCAIAGSNVSGSVANLMQCQDR
jgi:hypothetical protein